MAEQGGETTFDLALEVPANGGLNAEARRNRAILADVYSRMLDGDEDALMKILDPDVTFHEASSLPYGCDNSGVEGARAGVAAMFSAWTHVRSIFYEFTAGGDLVIAFLRFTGTSRATGDVYDEYGTEVFRFRDGRVIEWRPFYWDTHAVRTACGM